MQEGSCRFLFHGAINDTDRLFCVEIGADVKQLDKTALDAIRRSPELRVVQTAIVVDRFTAKY
jgi:hypothetical protein